MAGSKASVTVDEDRKQDDVVEDALREFLNHPAHILDRLRPQRELSDDEAMELALRETEAYRSGG